ncbi:MAG: protein-L-isoaspartate(D-aspartate) O-methyltransferase [Planctomycetia bacterium]|nr:protein-L-isoaspartate(D-aspartate) O-methyltransferase [Planctomycetia bacterium]
MNTRNIGRAFPRFLRRSATGDPGTVLLVAVGTCIALLLGTYAAPARGADALSDARNRMVDEEIVAAGVKDRRVIESMRTTPRHEFVPLAQRRNAYLDMALPIGERQTISPPFVVAYMTEQIDPRPTDRVLEIGTGSGYQAAVLSPLVKDVYTIEIVESLGRRAAAALKRLKYDNVHAKVGDGYQGWPEHAPFDKIIVTCSPEAVPAALAEQLKEGGRMIIPVGERYQQTLYLLSKKDGELVREKLIPTLFVPMTGAAEQGRRILPDPAKPSLANGDFEEALGGDGKPAGWHYQRQMERIEAADAPSGKHYARFTNAEPGRGCQALQGFAIDGREVRGVQLSLSLRGKDIRPGQVPQQLPAVGITFYGENRETLGERRLGPWQGTFPWQNETSLVDVPIRAREAIVRVGLFGAVGELDLDNVELKPADK